MNTKPEFDNQTVQSRILIHTDGSCLGNPGPGGYAAIIQMRDGGTIIREKAYKGGQTDTTNNRMELTAAIEALSKIKKHRDLPITIRTDSQYLVKAMTEWLSGWKARSWRKADKKPVENRDLFEQLDEFDQNLNITWEWVRGHSGDELNEKVDRLAHKEAEKLRHHDIGM